MKRLLPALLAAGSLALAACGSSDPEPTPPACLGGSAVFLTALEGAPQSALVGGEVPIGDCLVADQPPGQINTVGSAMVAAATQLNDQATESPAGEATTKLGYLVGSVEEAASQTGGIHTDLVRRLNSAARFTEGEEALPAGFERAFGAAYAAARGDG